MPTCDRCERETSEPWCEVCITTEAARGVALLSAYLARWARWTAWLAARGRT